MLSRAEYWKLRSNCFAIQITKVPLKLQNDGDDIRKDVDIDDDVDNDDDDDDC